MSSVPSLATHSPLTIAAGLTGEALTVGLALPGLPLAGRRDRSGPPARHRRRLGAAVPLRAADQVQPECAAAADEQDDRPGRGPRPGHRLPRSTPASPCHVRHRYLRRPRPCLLTLGTVADVSRTGSSDQAQLLVAGAARGTVATPLEQAGVDRGEERRRAACSRSAPYRTRRRAWLRYSRSWARVSPTKNSRRSSATSSSSAGARAGQAQRQQAVLAADQEHHRELQALRGVQGQQRRPPRARGSSASTSAPVAISARNRGRSSPHRCGQRREQVDR